jgi:hypothetical protein
MTRTHVYLSLLTAILVSTTSIVDASADISPDVMACLKSVVEKDKELSPLYQKVIARNESKLTLEMNKLRDAIKLERLKKDPPSTLIDCNRMLSNLNAAIRFANDKLAP